LTTFVYGDRDVWGSGEWKYARCVFL